MNESQNRGPPTSPSPGSSAGILESPPLTPGTTTMQLRIAPQMRQSQQMKLTMTPLMIMTKEMLQLPAMELQSRIDEELSQNMMLEQLSSDPDAVCDTESERNLAAARNEANGQSTGEQELVVDGARNNEADFERLLEISDQWSSDNISAGSRRSANAIDDMSERAHHWTSNLESRSQTLNDHLLEQYVFFRCEEPVREFGKFLIGNLDHHGRLPSTLPEFVQLYRMSGGEVTHESAEEALGLIQRLDPPGVGARDVRECLLLQIGPEHPYRDVLVTLITSHFEDIANNRLPAIERRTGYSLETIKSAIVELKTLDPYPGRGFEQQPVERITPDISVERKDDGTWTVNLLDEYVPQLRISRRYVKMLRNNPDAMTRKFIKTKLASAKWLIDAIEQRYATLRLVARAIVDRQSAFLDGGPDDIVPLKMQEIADIVKMHVSTVSRAVAGKYVQTPRGVFPLKRFFAGGTQAADGSDVAWENVRRKLKEIIDGEDKSKPLSDDALVDELGKHGFNVARRTVTKYRETMRILTSRQRREF